MYDEIVSELNLISFTNPFIGLTFYYLESTNQYLFENYSMQGTLDLERMPILMKTRKMTYYGPHTSLNPLDGSQVFSVRRKVELPQREDVSLYIETSFRLAETIINNEPLNASTYHLIVDGDGRITYSENEVDFRVGGMLPVMTENKQLHKGYYLFGEQHRPTWNIVAAVPVSAFESEINDWKSQFILFSVLSIAVSSMFALIIWRSLYKPMYHLYQDIRYVNRSQLSYSPRWSNNLEFNTIHSEVTKMRRRITELIEEVEQKEKRKAEMEVERLMHQINPHFLHNTLDTIRWIARTKGEHEIDRLVSTLNKVLHYNLNKQKAAPIKDELDAIREYIMLQGIRYHFQFDLRIQADEQVLKLPVPKFILQPIVENALFHGLDDDNGLIEVSVSQENKQEVEIRIKDNGQGMEKEEIIRLLSGETDDHKTFGLGIGLPYVVRTLQFHFGEKANLSMESEPGYGTTVILRLPIAGGGDMSCSEC
ncbi:sensor histidine kinase [Paenibacillus chungangensis]|uniref:histidine kinase n=1 Tax=Paenibacillus chungangensis TaxID=696535 RepID=A0ABW3HLM4_9BACL